MAVVGDTLFRDGGDLSDFLAREASRVTDTVNAVPGSGFDAKADTELPRTLIGAATIAPLSIDLSKASVHVEEVLVEERDMFDGSFSTVPGSRFTKRIPFTGDGRLWRLSPNRFDCDLHKGYVTGSTLVIGVAVSRGFETNAHDCIKQQTTSIENHLSYQKVQIDEYNETISARVLRAIEIRRQRRAAGADALKGL